MRRWHSYQTKREPLEEPESIRVYDLAKASDEKAVPFEQAVQEIERDRRCPGSKPQRGDSI